MDSIREFLVDLMTFTAWRMEKPAAYGPFHLTFTFVGLAVCLLLAFCLRRLAEKGNRRLLLGVGIFLLLTELYKQLFYTFYIGGGSYQWWIFPFQLCSIPMYLCVIAPFVKNLRARHGMYAFMTTFNLLGGFMAFAEPSGIVHEYWTLTLHAFIWHMTLVFLGFYLIASGRGATTLRDFRGGVLTFLALCAVAFAINLAVKYGAGEHINMFFIGPAKTSLAVFKDIAEATDWYVATLLYIPAVCLGAFLVFLPVYLYNKKRAAAEESQKTEKVPTRVG